MRLGILPVSVLVALIDSRLVCGSHSDHSATTGGELANVLLGGGKGTGYSREALAAAKDLLSTLSQSVESVNAQLREADTEANTHGDPHVPSGDSTESAPVETRKDQVAKAVIAFANSVSYIPLRATGPEIQEAMKQPDVIQAVGRNAGRLIERVQLLNWDGRRPIHGITGLSDPKLQAALWPLVRDTPELCPHGVVAAYLADQVRHAAFSGARPLCRKRTVLLKKYKAQVELRTDIFGGRDRVAEVLASSTLFWQKVDGLKARLSSYNWAKSLTSPWIFKSDGLAEACDELKSESLASNRHASFNSYLDTHCSSHS